MGVSEETIPVMMENEEKKIESDCAFSESNSDKEEMDEQISVDDNEIVPHSTKPQLSYIALITKAIKSKPNEMATLGEICKYIYNNYYYYKVRYPKWQNSIRHNLSLNDCFVRVARGASNPGKGNFWKMDPLSANMFENGSMLRRRKRFKRQDRQYYTLFNSPFFGAMQLPNPLAYHYQMSPPYLHSPSSMTRHHHPHQYHPYHDNRLAPPNVVPPPYVLQPSLPAYHQTLVDFEMRQRFARPEAAMETSYLNTLSNINQGMQHAAFAAECRRSMSPPSTNEASLSDGARSPSPLSDSSKEHRYSPLKTSPKKKHHSAPASLPSTSSDQYTSNAVLARSTSFTIESILSRPSNCPRPPSPTDE